MISLQVAAPEVYTMQTDYMRTTEAAERLGVSTRTITRWVERGYFPGAFKVNPEADNSPYMIPLSAIEALERKRREGVDLES
jgi:predicted site-specific integrase-resolvase